MRDTNTQFIIKKTMNFCQNILDFIIQLFPPQKKLINKLQNS